MVTRLLTNGRIVASKDASSARRSRALLDGSEVGQNSDKSQPLSLECTASKIFGSH